MNQSLISKLKLLSSTININNFNYNYNNTRQISCLSKIVLPSSASVEQNPPAVKRKPLYISQNLYSRLSNVWFSGEKISDVLDHFLGMRGNHLNVTDLLACIRNFRSNGHYQRCLEILEWMEKRIDYKDNPLHLNLIFKTKGIVEAERFFYCLPPSERSKALHGTLLFCYCSEKMTDKALALFDKLDKMNYCNTSVFCNLMCLYQNLNQPEKVPLLVEEMKRRNVPLNTFCYQVWMQSCARVNDFEGVERVMDEVQKQKSIKYDWNTYSGYASVYMKAGQYQKAGLALKKMEEIIDNLEYSDRIAYNHLISLYGSVGDSEGVARAWAKLKSIFKVCNNTSYLRMLQALSKLGNLEQLKMCLKEWDSSYRSYDVKLPGCLVSFYLRHDMFDEAELLLKDITNRAGQKVCSIHVLFMEYFLCKQQIDSALKHLEVALANRLPWQPHAKKLDKFFVYFIEKKDVDSAERLCQMLEKDPPVPLTIYMGLLQTYAAAGKKAPEMRQRMVRGGVKFQS